TLNYSTLITTNNTHNQIYTLFLHDALPISKTEKDKLQQIIRDQKTEYQREAKARREEYQEQMDRMRAFQNQDQLTTRSTRHPLRSEEHTSELQSPDHLVCRLLLEKKKKKKI